MEKNIYTNIKFAPHSKTGALVGFISKADGRWRGVREDSNCPKIIVLIDTDLKKRVQGNALYKCKLVPMTGKLGYVAVSASPVLFSANVEVEMLARSFRVNVVFGNEKIVYDSELDNFSSALGELEKKNIIKNLGEVIEEFKKCVNYTIAQYTE